MYRVTIDGNLLHDYQVKDYQILDAVVTLEINTPQFFQFTIYPNNPMYGSIQKLKSIIEVYDDGELIFRGRPLNDTLNLYKAQTIQCEGERAYLNDTQVSPFNFEGTLTQYLQLLITNHNGKVEPIKQFTLGNINAIDVNEIFTREIKDYNSTWNNIKTHLIDVFGGYFVLRRENNINYLDYIADSPYQSSQNIELTKNILDYQQEVKAEEIATVLIPLGAWLLDEEGKRTNNRLTINSVNSNNGYIEHLEGISKYGKIWAVQVFDDVEDATVLLAKAQSSLNMMVNLGVKISIRAVDLNLVDNDISKIRFFDYVRIVSQPHQINELMLIKKQTINLSDPSQNVIEVGVEFDTFTEKQIRRDADIKIIQSNYVTNDQVTQILNPVSLQVSQILQTYEQIQSTVASINTTYQEIVDSPITAYEIAVSNGFNGTQEEWIESLKGKDGTSVKILGTKANQSELPTANNLAGDGYIIDGDLWVWTGTQWTNVGRIQGQDGQDGIGYQLVLSGDDGLVFDSNTDTVSRNLRAKVYINNTDVTETLPNTYFTWTRKSNYPSIDNEFNAQGIQNKVLTLTSYYLQTSATYICTMTIPSISGYLLDNNDNTLTDANGNKIVVTSYSITFEQQITIVKDVAPQITTLRSDITQLAGEISLKVNQTTVDQLTNRVSTAESNITLTQNEISSKVSQTDFTGAKLVSMINQTASSVKVQAKNISLEGLTTVNGGFIVNMDGSITATSGNIAGWSIGDGYLDHAGTNRRLRLSTIDNYSIYAGTDGTNWNFILNTNGTIRARNADISGKITATSGTFSGTVSGSSITGGSINIGSGNFTVNSSGGVVAKSITTTGTHNGTGNLSSGTLAGNSFYRDASSGYTRIDTGIHTGGSIRVHASSILGVGMSSTSTSVSVTGYINSNGTRLTSDIRKKEDFQDIDNEFNEFIYSLPIGTYRWKNQMTDKRSIGVNANFVDALFPKEVTQYLIEQDEAGFYSANYTALVPMLVKVVQEQHHRLIDLEWKMAEMERRISE